jgi:simple sugar transport system ATP-binding protein
MGLNQDYLLKMKNISIEFPGVKALKNVNFTTATGTAHALVGANGAGKSTLMKVLSGAYGHYTGEIFINSQNVDIRSPKDAKDNGIEIVYQEVDTALIPYLTVAENIMLDWLANDMGRKQIVNWRKLHEEAAKVLKRLNINISTKKIVSELTLAQKQMILIARAIYKECRFLILDEPTAPLSNSETDELFRIVRDLKNNNVGIIFISHRLPELFEICDEVTVMRDGEFVASKKVSETNQNKIVESMLGRKFDENFPKYKINIGDKLFEIKGLNDEEKIKDINMYVCSGEIVGIAGLVGAGKTELCNALFNASHVVSGERVLNSEKLHIKSPYDAVKKGIVLVPEERRKEGIFVDESVTTNITVTNLGQFCKLKTFLNKKAEKEKAREIIKELGVKTPSENNIVGYLSGGNQQKVAVGKWLITDAKVYIFDEPTKGVDIGAKRDIFELIGQLAKNGKSIIYASCELAEILGITDRIYVMYGGRIVKELNTKNTNEEEILFYSTGGM